MALPTHYTGSDGEIQIGGTPTTLVNFNIDVSVGVINSARIGKVSDMKYAGKKNVSGTITQVLVTGDLLAMLLGGTPVESTLETLLAATSLTGSRAEETITTSPANPTTVTATLTVGDDDSAAGSIVIHGTDASDVYVTEVLPFTAMLSTDAPQVVRGTQAFKTTDFVDIEADLDGYVAVHSTLGLQGVAGTKTVQPGTSTLFNIIGKVEDANGKSFQMTANNCFFTAGSFPIGDAETLVETDLPFVMRDADNDLTLVWSSA